MSGIAEVLHNQGYEVTGSDRADSAVVTRLRELYKKDGGAFPDGILNMTWAYSNPSNPAPEEVAREFNGRALADVMSPPDPKNPKEPPKVLVKAGEQLPGFGMLRDDGSTTCGNWIYSGVWSQAGNNSARRDCACSKPLDVLAEGCFCAKAT